MGMSALHRRGPPLPACAHAYSSTDSTDECIPSRPFTRPIPKATMHVHHGCVTRLCRRQRGHGGEGQLATGTLTWLRYTYDGHRRGGTDGGPKSSQPRCHACGCKRCMWVDLPVGA